MITPTAVEFSVSFDWPGQRLVALVEGGWQFPIMVSPGMFLLDSSAFNKVLQFGRGTDDMNEWERNHWRQILDSEQTVFNPMPRAFEGPHGYQSPTEHEFKKRFEEDCKMLNSMFPKVQVIVYDKNGYSAGFQMVQNVASQNERDLEFLLEVAPLITDVIPRSRRREVQEHVIKSAKMRNLDFTSLALLGSLSCIYAGGPNEQISRRILKPHKIAREGNAYNALLDFAHLRLFLAMTQLAKEMELPSFAFCTCDRALAAFWCGMRFSNVRRNDEGGLQVDFVISDILFPSLDDKERAELVGVLKPVPAK